jgi:hypothetical protein
MNATQIETIAQGIAKAIDAVTDSIADESRDDATIKAIIATALEPLSPSDQLAVSYRLQIIAKAQMQEIMDEAAKVTEVKRLARAAGMGDVVADMMRWLLQHGLAIKIPQGWMYRRRAMDGTVTWVPIADTMLEGYGILVAEIEKEGE